jgi:hypothetical protein
MVDIDNTEPIVQDTPAVDTPQPKVELPEDKVIEIQKKAFGYAFGQVDARLAEIGYEKPNGMKTTDYLVELLTKKDKEVGTKEPTNKVDDVELTAKLKGLQDALRQKEVELEQVKSSVSSQKRDFWLDSIVNSTPIVTPDYLSDQEKARWENRQRSLIKSELLTNYDIKEVEGQFRFYGKDGSPIFDGTIDMNPIKPESLIGRDFSELLKKPEAPKKQEVKGTGVTEASKESVERVIPPNVKTASEFYSYLREELRLTLGSEEFKSKIAKAKIERPALFN